MKRTILFFAVFILCTHVFARQGGNFGLGAVIGDPTGLSCKYWTGHNKAWEGALALWGSHHHYDSHNDLHMVIQACHLWHNFDMIRVSQGAMPLYLGVGGRLVFGHEFLLGVRGCGGIAYMFQNVPVDIFLELGLVVDFVTHPGADMDAGLGVRYFFQ
jgi:hypothetical protein